METAVVVLCVLGALVYMGRTMYLRMTRKGSGCGCGCSGCGAKAPGGKISSRSPAETSVCAGERRP